MEIDFEAWDRLAHEQGELAFMKVIVEVFGPDMAVNEVRRILDEPTMAEVALYAPRFNEAVARALG